MPITAHASARQRLNNTSKPIMIFIAFTNPFVHQRMNSRIRLLSRAVGAMLIVLSEPRSGKLGGYGRQHLTAHLAKSDRCRAVPLAPSPKDHGVPILEKGALLVLTDLERQAAALAQFDQRSRLGRRGSRLRAAAEQIAGAQIAPIDSVMRYQLRDGPIRIPETRLGKALGRLAAPTHFRGLDQGLEPDVDGAGLTVVRRVQIRQGLRIGLRPRECRSKGRQGVESDDPGRNSRCEVLRQERSQRLVLPTLQVAG